VAWGDAGDRGASGVEFADLGCFFFQQQASNSFSGVEFAKLHQASNSCACCAVGAAGIEFVICCIFVAYQASNSTCVAISRSSTCASTSTYTSTSTTSTSPSTSTSTSTSTNTGTGTGTGTGTSSSTSTSTRTSTSTSTGPSASARTSASSKVDYLNVAPPYFRVLVPLSISFSCFLLPDKFYVPLVFGHSIIVWTPRDYDKDIGHHSHSCSEPGFIQIQ
jgi:hypothetical protein